MKSPGYWPHNSTTASIQVNLLWQQYLLNDLLLFWIKFSFFSFSKKKETEQSERNSPPLRIDTHKESGKVAHAVVPSAPDENNIQRNEWNDRDSMSHSTDGETWGESRGIPPDGIPTCGFHSWRQLGQINLVFVDDCFAVCSPPRFVPKGGKSR